ncbi:energy-coupling factor transporter transmembrane component T family protein [Senegalia sp. (in: firmicutes)]|uniref:energy-coupling factor transporter transmembrane component T family protein n=1 Tax=Senegalia sp. (in: firmicutes) TaxID=1924098 RepID=UPI003F95D0C5
MENKNKKHPEYTLLYLFSLLFLVSLIDSWEVLALIGFGSIIYYLVMLKDFKFYQLFYPVLPFIILLLVPSFINFFILGSFEVGEFYIKIIYKVALSSLMLGTVLKKHSRLYMVEGVLNIGLPSVLNRILALTFRYFYMIYEDVMVGRKALYSRGLRNRGPIDSLKIWGEWIGGFFLKSADHSEKVYDAMRARGFTGESRGSFFQRKDLCLRLAIILVVLTTIGYLF